MKIINVSTISLVIICSYAELALAWNKPVTEVIAESADGKVLRKTYWCPGEGGCQISYEILDSNGKELNKAPVSSDFTETGDSGLEHISAGACRKALEELKASLAKFKFENVKINLDSCDSDRSKAVRKDSDLEPRK